MSKHIYTLPVEQTKWHTPSSGEIIFNWEYDSGREKMLSLYEKGKKKQWNATERINWNHELDPENPNGTPDEAMPLYGSHMWDKMDENKYHNVDNNYYLHSLC